LYAVNYSMHVLITVFDPVICKTPDAPLAYIVCHFAR